MLSKATLNLQNVLVLTVCFFAKRCMSHSCWKIEGIACKNVNCGLKQERKGCENCYQEEEIFCLTRKM
jgi:hypothetical protein